MGIFTKGVSQLAFDGILNCPICSQAEDYDGRKQRWKTDRWITPYLVRYICKKCGTPIRYDVSAQLTGKNLGFMKNHPYANMDFRKLR